MGSTKQLLLGQAQTDYGSFVCHPLNDGTTACVLSVGADRASPSLAAKGDVEHPNEDALLAMDDGAYCVAAVADAHFGRDSGHVLIERLAERLDDTARSLEGLQTLVASLGDESGPASPSATTLLVVAYDRRTNQGFGLSYGDSSFALLGGAATGEPLNDRSFTFVSPVRPRSLALENAHSFRFQAAPGQLLLAFTDGIDECHYGEPETSVRPRHLRALFEEIGPDPERFATRLTELALRGVDGHPGGQDNIALVAIGA